MFQLMLGSNRSCDGLTRRDVLRVGSLAALGLTLPDFLRLRARAQEPEKIEALINLVEEDLGYQLHQAVQRVKMDLSHEESAEFRFRDGSMDIVATVSRADFEEWIAEDLRSIERCVDGLLLASNIAPREVDRVFLTGGTSFVPAVRRIFESRFTAARVRTGNEFTSVARGLAVRAAEMDASKAEAGLGRGV